MEESSRSRRTLESASGRVRITAGQVRVVDGPDRGRSRALDAAPLVVGASSSCDLTLHDPKVSRRHVELALGPYGFLVRDLGSKNGTYFEGSRVGEMAVPPGAILKLGDSHVAITAVGAPERIPPSHRTRFGDLVGASLPMRRLFTMLERAAQSDATVLLGGETGCGKELAARAMHLASSRARGPYEIFDCGAVAPSLIASELFGHVRGAFSGADRDRAGVFERAHGGTVFLDEIGELPSEIQPALLRACDHGEIMRVGGNQAKRVDVRIIAATRRDLAAEVVAGRFREDLYYRLQVLPIVIPPLRARKEDLPMLCAKILAELGAGQVGPVEGDPLAQLQSHSWPGNVRELRNVLERAMVDAGPGTPFTRYRFTSGVAGPPPLPAAPSGAVTFQDKKKEAMDRFERDFLSDLMRESEGNIKRASRVSGIERTQLKRLLRRHGLI